MQGYTIPDDLHVQLLQVFETNNQRTSMKIGKVMCLMMVSWLHSAPEHFVPAIVKNALLRTTHGLASKSRAAVHSPWVTQVVAYVWLDESYGQLHEQHPQCPIS